MSRLRQNDCVQCPQGCTHCGRDKDYWLIKCDLCGNQVTTEEVAKVETIFYHDLCPTCAQKVEEATDTLESVIKSFMDKKAQENALKYLNEITGRI